MVSLSRRDLVLSAATAATVFGLDGPLAFIGAAEAKLPEAGKGVFKTKVGNAELITLFDGSFAPPNKAGFIKNASVDDISKAQAAAGEPTDKIVIPFTIPVVRTGGKTIMFDAGTGGQLAPTAGLLGGNMAVAGIDPAKIDMIVVTHFHPDHIFGLMAKDTNAPIYPNAEIVVPEAEFKWWNDAGVFAKLPEARHGLAKRIQATIGKWKNVRQIADGAEVVPGLRAVATHGHTPGHTIFHLASGSEQVMLMADTANVPQLFVKNPGWHAAFDTDPVMAEAARRKTFMRAVAEKCLVSGYHFGFPGAGRMLKDGSGYAFVPVTA